MWVIAKWKYSVFTLDFDNNILKIVSQTLKYKLHLESFLDSVKDWGKFLRIQQST